MADMRRRGRQPPPGLPQVQFTPGLADQMLRELAPLLAEEGIDVDNIDIADLDTLQRALNRAVERRNMELFSPVGETRDIALVTLRLVVQAILDGDTTLAAALLDQVQPNRRTTPPPPSPAASIGLGLLDNWLSSQGDAPAGLGQHTTLPAGHWNGEHAATDILALAGKGRAFRSLDTLLTHHGGRQLLTGSALALAAATDAWAQHTHTPRAQLTPTIIR